MDNVNFDSVFKKIKSGGIVLSILLIICGILIFTTPVGNGIFFTRVIIAYLFVNGIYRLVRYFGLPKELHNGWMLADAIISIVISILIVAELLVKPFGTTLGIIAMMGYLIGFYEFFVGINQLCSTSEVKTAGGSIGWLIFIGILNILCGMLVIAHPIMSYFTFEWMIGIYMCIFGITMLIECLCMKKTDKK